MKNIVIGILAHVDAGKTTLSEAMLYQTGAIRNLGRVDHKNAFLDTDIQERDRGITIFSKQAEMTYKDTKLMLLDTPGHVDFSAEMETNATSAGLRRAGHQRERRCTGAYRDTVETFAEIPRYLYFFLSIRWIWKELTVRRS